MQVSTKETRARSKRRFLRENPELKISRNDGRITFFFRMKNGDLPVLKSETHPDGYAGFYIGRHLFMPETRPSDWGLTEAPQGSMQPIRVAPRVV